MKLCVSALESSDSLQEKGKDVYSTYITFVSLNLKIYDIYFEQQGLTYVPHIGNAALQCFDLIKC